MFPLIVAEGTSGQKKTKLLHSNYLSRSYRSFAKIGGTLVAFGHSFGENDEHFIRLMGRKKSKVRKLFVSVHGDPESAGNQHLMRRAVDLRVRNERLEVWFYKAEEANVWGHN